MVLCIRLIIFLIVVAPALGINENNTIQEDDMEGLKKKLNETMEQMGAEIVKNAKIEQKLKEIESHDETVVDYDTGLIQLKNGSLVEASVDEVKHERTLERDPAMLHEHRRFLADLVCLLLAGTAAAAFAELQHLPAFIGFILGGIIVGPSGFALIAPDNVKYIDSLAQAGVSLMLFESGIGLDVDTIKRWFRMTAFIFTLQLSLLSLIVPIVLSYFLNISISFTSVFIFSLSMALSSSNSLWELKSSHNLNQPSIRIAVSLLAGQDLAMGLFFCLPDALHHGVLGVFIVLKEIIYGAFLTFVSIWFANRGLPWIGRFFGDRPSSKLFLLSTLCLCITFSSISVLLGLSIEFGAMFAGVVISNSDVGREIIHQLKPLTEVFSGILFASIGMLLSPRYMVTHFGTILLLFMFVISTKFVSGFIVAKSFGQSRQSSATIGLSVSTVAEFSMILAAKGYQLSILNRDLYLHVLAVTFLSFAISPVLFFTTAVIFSKTSEPAAHRSTSHHRDDDDSDSDQASILIHRT